MQKVSMRGRLFSRHTSKINWFEYAIFPFFLVQVWHLQSSFYQIVLSHLHKSQKSRAWAYENPSKHHLHYPLTHPLPPSQNHSLPTTMTSTMTPTPTQSTNLHQSIIPYLPALLIHPHPVRPRRLDAVFGRWGYCRVAGGAGVGV